MVPLHASGLCRKAGTAKLGRTGPISTDVPGCAIPLIRREYPRMSSARLVYCTFPSRDAAEDTARALLDAGLIACANILPGMVSLYRWQGAVERADEVVLILKSTAARTEAVVEAVRARHPYEVPAILVLPVEGGLPAFLSWIAAETGEALP